MHSAITHVSPDCLSFQEQRNAIADRGYGVWRGAVRVPRGSDNSTANQLCRSLLLSDKARVHVTPTLEIATDEVVCTHGATVADLDDEMIFYLQSRGLDRLSARSLMLQGWLGARGHEQRALGGRAAARRREGCRALAGGQPRRRGAEKDGLHLIERGRLLCAWTVLLAARKRPKVRPV